MTDTINRFLNNTLEQFIPRREYSRAQVIHKLETEIEKLHSWLLNNEPGSQTWTEKRKLMLSKMENLSEIKSETVNQK